MVMITITGRLVRDAEMILAQGRERMAFTVASTSGKETSYFSCYSPPSGTLDLLKKGVPVIVTGTLRSEVGLNGQRAFVNHRVGASHVEVLPSHRIDPDKWEKDFSGEGK